MRINLIEASDQMRHYAHIATLANSDLDLKEKERLLRSLAREMRDMADSIHDEAINVMLERADNPSDPPFHTV